MNRGRECRRAPKRYGPVREHKVAKFAGYGKPAARHSGRYLWVHARLPLLALLPAYCPRQGAEREDKAVGQELPAFERQALRRFVNSESLGGKAAPTDEFSQD